MGIKSGFILIVRLILPLISKLLSWLLQIVHVCGVIGMIVLHYLLIFIRWLLRLTEEDGGQMVTDHDKPVNTATNKGGALPAEANCVESNNQIEDTASDNDEADNLSQCPSDTDDITDDDEVQHPVSDGGGEQVLVITSAVPMECTETNSPQEMVLTVDKITEELRKQLAQEPVQSQEDTGLVVGNCDDDSDEDSKADCLDYLEQEEQIKFYGAVPKSDDSGTTEAIMTVGQHHNVMIGDDRSASHVEPAEEAVQQDTGEVNHGGNQQATSTIPSDSTGVGIIAHHGMFPNSMIPND